MTACLWHELAGRVSFRQRSATLEREPERARSRKIVDGCSLLPKISQLISPWNDQLTNLTFASPLVGEPDQYSQVTALLTIMQ